MSDLRYPIGTFTFDDDVSDDSRRIRIESVAAAPGALRRAVTGLSDQQLDTPYRPGGWTVREVVHHVPDSHINAYVRFKLALTEDDPVIKPYQEAGWAQLPDSRETPIEVSLELLDSLHARWVILLRSMTPAQWARPLQHPESGPMTLDRMLALYDWHGRHHVAHVTSLRARARWD